MEVLKFTASHTPFLDDNSRAILGQFPNLFFYRRLLHGDLMLELPVELSDIPMDEVGQPTYSRQGNPNPFLALRNPIQTRRFEQYLP